MAEPGELQKSLSKLSLSGSTAPTVTHTKENKSITKQKIADSWEDEDSSASDSEEAGLTLQVPKVHPNAPPPTPISPTSTAKARSAMASPPQSTIAERFSAHEDIWEQASNGDARTRVDDGRRPEKTNAVAGRLIAGALGVRAPKKTDEQRAYDRAVREKEQKRRDLEKEEAKRKEEEIAKAKAAAWED